MKPIITCAMVCIAASGGAFAGGPLEPQVDAVEVAEDIYSLGYALMDGQIVEGYAFVNRGAGHPLKQNKQEKFCYEHIAEGAIWKAPEYWTVNPFNDEGLSPFSVLEIVLLSMEKWEFAAEADIFRENMFITSRELSADYVSPDGFNELYFGNFPDPSVVALTVIWGIFDTKVKNRIIVECDQVYNTAWAWSTNGEAGKMDFESVVTHELGHAAGMGHVSCGNQTMYPYIALGELGKRTLGEGDVRGIWKLYKGAASEQKE